MSRGDADQSWRPLCGYGETGVLRSRRRPRSDGSAAASARVDQPRAPSSGALPVVLEPLVYWQGQALCCCQGAQGGREAQAEATARLERGRAREAEQEAVRGVAERELAEALSGAKSAAAHRQ